MAYPPAYVRAFSFTDYEVNFPGEPKPGDKLDTEYDAVANALTATQTNLALIQRADGALANESVGEDQLEAGLFDAIGDAAVADAEAAAAAAAASASLAAGSASSADASAIAASTSAGVASGAAAQAGVSQGIAQTAANDAAAASTVADDAADVAVQAANDTAGSVAATEAAVQRAFEWAELLTGPVLPAPPGWPEAVDDGMFSSKWWAIRAREYNSTETIDLGTAGADIGEAFDIWDAIPGNDLGVGQTYATWGTPTHTYVLIDRSNPSDPASWLDITGGPGPPGPPNTLTVGTVTTGAPGSSALVSITGVSPNQVLNMQIPRGDVGATGAIGPAGPPNSLAIGTVTTVPDGTPSSATITGTAPTQTLNLTLTAGPPGIQGIQGIQGPAGPAVNLANPTGVIGLAAVNGVATTAPRSDSSPALSQAIVPTWTGAHKFANVVKFGEVADPGLAAADEYWLTAQDDSGITRLWAHNARAAWVVNQDNYIIGRNVSGGTIAKMRAVRAVGGSANRPTIGLADAATGQAGGITAASSANNAFVEVMTLGVLTNVDTSAWPPATRLYLGTAGVLTSTPPAFPNALQLLGVVLDQHAVNGSVYVTRTNDSRAGITAGDGFANPTANVGLAAVNGSAITMMRSDAAPALSQAIAPTWTGFHTFTGAGPFDSETFKLQSAAPAIHWRETGVAADNGLWVDKIDVGARRFAISTDGGAYANYFVVFRNLGVVTTLEFGNSTNNPAFSFLGTGLATFGGNITATPAVFALEGAVSMKIQAINSTLSGLVGTQSAHPLEIRTSNSIRATWSADGSSVTISPSIREVNGTAALPSYSWVGEPNLGFFRDVAGAVSFASSGKVLMFSNQGIENKDGAVGQPSYTFSGDPDTGFYRNNVNAFAAVTGGAFSAGFLPTGQVSFNDGSAAAPAVTFNADLDTGMYRVAADSIGFATAGVARWGINATGKFEALGTTQVLNSSGSAGLPSYSFASETDSGMYSPGSDLLAWSTGGLARMTLSNSTFNIGSGIDSTFQGNVSAVSFTTTSARASKRETGAPSKPASILARLRPIMYRLLAGGDNEQLGLIAEEVHEVCPQLSDGKTVAYDRLAILLLAAWQDEHAEAA